MSLCRIQTVTRRTEQKKNSTTQKYTFNRRPKWKRTTLWWHNTCTGTAKQRQCDQPKTLKSLIFSFLFVISRRIVWQVVLFFCQLPLLCLIDIFILPSPLQFVEFDVVFFFYHFIPLCAVPSAIVSHSICEFDGMAFGGFCVCEIDGRRWHAHQFTIKIAPHKPCVFGWSNAEERQWSNALWHRMCGIKWRWKLKLKPLGANTFSFAPQTENSLALPSPRPVGLCLSFRWNFRYDCVAPTNLDSPDSMCFNGK